MIVLCSFRIQTGSEMKESPAMGCVDLEKLKELFPGNSAWSESNSNILNLNLEQAKDLYSEMVAFYARTEVCAEKYISGGALNIFQIGSDLQSLFNGLIDFFEKELGFSSSPEIAKAVADKRAKQVRKTQDDKIKIREEIVETFKVFGSLKPPKNDVVRARIEKKLAQYRARLLEVQHHPEMAIYISNKYRDSVHKIAVCEAVLSNRAEIQVVDLAVKQLESFGECFDDGEFFQAVGDIAAYLETPFSGTELAPSHSKVST